MKKNAKREAPEIIIRKGKPAAVILDIEHYKEMLERLEDIKDLKMLVETRKTPLKFRRLGDVLKEYSPGVWVYIERRAERDLKKLSAEDFHRIITHIKGLAEKPRPPSVASWLVQKNEWRQRVGSYRVIYEIDDKEKIIRIMRVRHRWEVYR